MYMKGRDLASTSIPPNFTMSHQRLTSQSLPHDYAILSHFNDDARREQDYLPIANDDSEPFHPRGIPIGRGRAATLADISERTPLIKHVPPIPRIHEDIDESVCSDQQSEQIPSAQMFREEVGILTRYSLPVFACVPKCISNKIAYWLVARMSLNTPLFLCPSSV